MKIRRYALAAALMILLSLCGCQKREPSEVLYERFLERKTEFFLPAEDCNDAFAKMFAAHPEQLIHLDTVSIKQSTFGFKITLEYANTEMDADAVLCGSEDEMALASLEKTLENLESSGMMVIAGGADPKVEEYTDRLAEKNYLATMGVKSTQWQLITNDFTKDVVVQYTLEYDAPTDLVHSYRKAVAERVKALPEELWTEDTPPEGRVRAIHDYLIQNTRYTDGKTETMVDHTPYGPLLKGRGVCDGYTYAANLLLNAAGIENYIVIGTADGEGHSWNMVKLGEQYYHLDITWDDPVDATGKQHLTYDYYLKSDADFLSDHVWEYDKFPDCKKSYN